MLFCFRSGRSDMFVESDHEKNLAREERNWKEAI